MARAQRAQIILAVVLGLMALKPAPSAAQSVSCSDESTAGIGYTVCHYSSTTSVYVSHAGNGKSFAAWFTPKEFAAWKAKLDYQRPSNHKSEAQAQSWHTQDYCEADGFVWKDGGCHAKPAGGTK